MLSSLGRYSLKVNRLHQRHIVSLGLTSLSQVSIKKRSLLKANPIPVNNFDLTTVGALTPIANALFSTDIPSTDEVDSAEPIEDKSDAGRIKKGSGKWPSPRNTQPSFTAYISGLGLNQEVDYVKSLFLQFGPIDNTYFPKKSSSDYYYGFISFKDYRSLNKALQAGTINCEDGKTITITRTHQKKSKQRNCTDIYVNGLSKDITLNEINDYFQQFGKIEIINLHIPMFGESKRRRATSVYAIIRFKTIPSESFYSIQHIIGDGKVSVDYFAQDIQDKMRFNKLFISDFSKNVSEEEIRTHFGQYGDILKVQLFLDAGCGYVFFADQSSVAAAAESRWHAVGSSDMKARKVGLVNND